MNSYLTVTSNGLHLLKSFEERDAQKSSDFQNYFKASQIVRNDDFSKVLPWKIFREPNNSV